MVGLGRRGSPDSVQLGHLQIHEHDVWCEGGDLAQRLLARAGKAGDLQVGLRGEYGCESVADDGALTVLGGWFTTISDFPGWLQQVSRLTPSYRYTELGWRAVDGVLPSATGVAILAAWTIGLGLLAGWSYRRFAAVR